MLSRKRKKELTCNAVIFSLLAPFLATSACPPIPSLGILASDISLGSGDVFLLIESMDFLRTTRCG